MSGTFASGTARRLSVGTQTARGTRASAGGGTILRRIQSNPNLQVDKFMSQELLQSQQIRDMGTGNGRGIIPYASQLAPGAQAAFVEAIARRPFSVGPSSGPLTNVTAAAGPPGTFTRAAGSWIADGFRVGMVVRWSGWTTGGVGNNARNYRIIALSATVMTVVGIGAEVVGAKASGDSVTVAAVGRTTFIQPTGGTSPYLTFEDWIPDIAVPRCDVYEDCRIQAINLNLPATGFATISAQLLARDVVTQATAHFTAPAQPPATNSVSGVSGTIRFGGQDIGILTSMGLQIAQQVGGDPVVGADRLPDIFVGPLSVRGNFTAYLRDYSFIDMMRNGTEGELMLMLESDSSLNSHFIGLTLPRAQLMNVAKSDGPMQLTQSAEFQALENVVTATGYEATTFMWQDSSL